MPLRESHLSVFLIFLRFGLLAWGGPVAQIAMLREELVEKRGWVEPERFRRALAVYQALPGPEAHELCVYFGMVRAGRVGGVLAGLGFMLPGLLLILALAWLYTRFGAQAVLPLFVGIAPAVAALIMRAAHRIATHVLTGRSQAVAMLAAVILTLAGVHFSVVFVLCALWQALWSAGYRRHAMIVGSVLCLAAMAWALWHPASAHPDVITESNGLLTEGLKAGLLSFGGAYTSIPFLQHSMVDHYPNITQQVFLDSIALSNVIPAPLIIFGTFLGYMADGITGALLMTLGIFIPAFAFTLIGHRYLEKMMDCHAFHGALDGISAAVAGLLALTALGISSQVVTGIPQALIFAPALFCFYRLRGKWVVPTVMLTAGILGFWLTRA